MRAAFVATKRHKIFDANYTNFHEFANRLTMVLSLSLRFDRGLELLGKQRKEFAGGEGPLRAE